MFCFARVVEQLSVEGVIEEERKPDILRSLIFNFTKIFLFHGIPYLHFHCKIKWIFCSTSFWKYQTFANICKLKSKYLRPLSYSNYKYPCKILFQLITIFILEEFSTIGTSMSIPTTATSALEWRRVTRTNLSRYVLYTMSINLIGINWSINDYLHIHTFF